MKPIKFRILQPPKILKEDVECFRIIEYSGGEEFAVKTSPNAAPGILFQASDNNNNNGQSAIETITNQAGVKSFPPSLFLYGLGIEPSIMNFTKGPYTTIEVNLKPFALNTLFGLNASALTNGFVTPGDFSANNINEQLLNACDIPKRIALLTDFLIIKLTQKRTVDRIVEESLRLIFQNPACVSVKSLLEHFNISQRQFERRFSQAVGISPHSYIRVKRFNEAIRLIKAGRYETLTNIAYALNYYDQSHLIRDIHTFSGITPKTIAKKDKDTDFYQTQMGYSYR